MIFGANISSLHLPFSVCLRPEPLFRSVFERVNSRSPPASQGDSSSQVLLISCKYLPRADLLREPPSEAILISDASRKCVVGYLLCEGGLR
ncbi:hypothetical protein Trydic_g11674 [Trypoxylus dichotomus]